MACKCFNEQQAERDKAAQTLFLDKVSEGIKARGSHCVACKIGVWGRVVITLSSAEGDRVTRMDILSLV